MTPSLDGSAVSTGTLRRSEFTTRMVSSLQPARVHRTHTKPTTCIDFSADGRTLASSGTDDTIGIYNCLEGTVSGVISMRKYGAGEIRFLRQTNQSTLLVASTIGHGNAIRAMDVSTRSYVRYFEGHSSRVGSLAASPSGPGFISGSRDGSVRVWDVRSQDACGKVHASGSPIVAYDPKGLIFGITYCDKAMRTKVKLFDARSYDDGPFLEFALDNVSQAPPTCLKFSSDGEYFALVNTDVNPSVGIYDAYEGGLFRTFVGHRNASGVSLEVDFSPDSLYVASGSDDGSLFVWDLKMDKPLMTESEIHALPATCVAWNPVYAMLATACQNVVMWLPDDDEVYTGGY